MPTPSPGITNKVIVITGASSGLGEAAARLLAEKGAKLALGARRVDRLQALAQELGGDVIVQATDVTDAAQVQALADAALARFGRIDVMVNNAGLMPHSPLERRKIAEWDQMIDVNIKGVLYGIAAVLPTMQAQKSGHIVNVASVAGLKVRGGATVYAATKHAVRALSEGLRLEVKPYNIRTTVISPGALDTELIDHITEPDVLEGVKKTYANAISSDVFARALVYALEQPPEVDVNEIVFRPTRQEF